MSPKSRPSDLPYMNSHPVLPATYILLPNLPPVYFSVSRVFTCGLDRCHLYHGQCFGSHGHRCYPCVSCTIGQERDHDSYHYVIMIRIILDVVSDYCIAFTVMHAVAGAAVFGNGTRSLHACSGVSCCVRCWYEWYSCVHVVWPVARFVAYCSRSFLVALFWFWRGVDRGRVWWKVRAGGG